MGVNIQDILAIAEQAGAEVFNIYNSVFPLESSTKTDGSLLTQADKISHQEICSALKKQYPHIPIVSEESEVEQDYTYRQTWEYFFLVDPLDGTKEFVQRNGEFTINIALIKNGEPVLGVIHVPVVSVSYYAEKGSGAFKIENKIPNRLPYSVPPGDHTVRVAVSRSHHCLKTESYLNDLRSLGKQVVMISSGSAIKFGLVAEGVADVYPRFGPTMECDTAAGHILVREVGKELREIENNQPLRYNKRSLKNPGFIVQ